MSLETGKTEQQEEPGGESKPVCPACGAEARRRDAKYCSTCGRSLEEHYRPADALRASYHLHRPAGARQGGKGERPPPPGSKKRPMSTMLPEVNRNGASTTALAFMTYALVPFLGILFVPGAVLIGVAGLLYSYRAPHRGGRRASLASVFCGLLILGVQLLLWWIIIKVPEWSNPGTGGY
jgi:ribosomal protein L37E